jgi:hypothetical protein
MKQYLASSTAGKILGPRRNTKKAIAAARSRVTGAIENIDILFSNKNGYEEFPRQIIENGCKD